MSADVFTEVMVTNALSPMRVVEVLGPLVSTSGTIAVMSSSQGSLTLNTNGGHEVYRASHIGFMGCYGAFPALRSAADTCRADTHRRPGWQAGLTGPGRRPSPDDIARTFRRCFPMQVSDKSTDSLPVP